MKLVEEIPYKQPIVHKLRGIVEQDAHSTTVGGLKIPGALHAKLQRRQGTYDTLQDAVNEKDIYLIGRETSRGIHWFGLVSSQFRETNVDRVSTLLGDLPAKRMIRYDQELERFQVAFPVREGASVVSIYFDSGDFGVYGGNGECAMQYGIAVSDRESPQWTLFRNKRCEQRSERVIHRTSMPSLDAVVQKQARFAECVEQMWEANRKREYTKQEVEAFAQAYLSRCQTVFDAVVNGVGDSVNGYELMKRLHQEAEHCASKTRLGLEALAGEFVINSFSHPA